MRIVSQDRQKDIPYDDMIVRIEGERSIIIYSLHNESDAYSSLGRYLNKERALEVMQEIRNVYHEPEQKGISYYMPRM